MYLIFRAGASIRFLLIIIIIIGSVPLRTARPDPRAHHTNVEWNENYLIRIFNNLLLIDCGDVAVYSYKNLDPTSASSRRNNRSQLNWPVPVEWNTSNKYISTCIVFTLTPKSHYQFQSIPKRFECVSIHRGRYKPSDRRFQSKQNKNYSI